MVGCGNSKMSEQMTIDDNFVEIWNLDISHVVLEKMIIHNESLALNFKKKYAEKSI